MTSAALNTFTDLPIQPPGLASIGVAAGALNGCRPVREVSEKETGAMSLQVRQLRRHRRFVVVSRVDRRETARQGEER